MSKRFQQLMACAFGIVFPLTMLTSRFVAPKPTLLHLYVVQVVFSLAAAGCAAMLPGFLRVNVSWTLRAGVALGIFIAVYVFNPATLVFMREVQFTRVIHFNSADLRTNVEPNPPTWNYGFTSLESDPTLVGNNVVIRKVKVILDVDCVPDGMNLDVWAFFGPADFGLPQGQVDHGTYPGFVLKSANGKANPSPPTQLKADIGAEHCSPQAWAQYDFFSGIRSGSPRLQSIKESSNPPMTLAAGLFSQIFIWTSDPRYTVHVHGAVAMIEGTLQQYN